MDIQHSLLPIYRKNPPKGYSIPLSELWSSLAHAAFKLFPGPVPGLASRVVAMLADGRFEFEDRGLRSTHWNVALVLCVTERRPPMCEPRQVRANVRHLNHVLGRIGDCATNPASRFAHCHGLQPNVELTGAARVYRSASSDRRERG